VLKDDAGGWSVELSATVDLDGDSSPTSPQLDATRKSTRDASDPAASGSSSRTLQKDNLPASGLPGSSSVHGRRLQIGSSISVDSALPASVFAFVLSSEETVVLSDPHKQTDATTAEFALDPYFQQRQPRALLCLPVVQAGTVLGVLYL
jgi:GAF domain-containing protein